jgi:hypothetical protein
MRTKSQPGGGNSVEALAHVSHFWAMVLFALLISVAAGSLTQRTTRQRIRYAGWSFGLFLLIAIAIGWLMYPISR